MGDVSHRLGARVAGWLVALVALAACPAPPRATSSPEAWWVGRAPAVRALLARAADLEGTPAGEAARQLDAVLPDCDVVGARAAAPDPPLLILETRCVGPDDPLAAELRPRDADLAFAATVSASRARADLRLDADALRGEIRWPHPDAAGPLALLVPGEAPAGPDLLAATGRLAHARVRTRDGIDLAAWLPAQTAGQRLRAWLVGLLGRVVLDGTWEAAVYPAERPNGLPRLAAALGVRAPRLASAAAERALDEAARRFGARRSALRLDAGEGACLSSLPALPELAPCYVATDEALVLGWNRASLLRALGPADAGPDVAARIEVELARLLGAGATSPWRALRVDGDLEGDVLEGRVALGLRP